MSLAAGTRLGPYEVVSQSAKGAWARFGIRGLEVRILS